MSNPHPCVARLADIAPRALAAALVGALATLAPLAAVEADLIATDHFLSGDDPDAGEYLATHLRRGNPSGGGQNPTIDGFTGAWSGNVFSGTGGVARWTAEEAGITTDLHYVQGGRARYAGVAGLQRRVQRSLDTYEPSDVYYMSFLLQAALEGEGGEGFAGIGFTNNLSGGGNDGQLELDGPDGLRGLMVGVKSNPEGTTDLVIRHRDQRSPGVFGATDTVIATDIDSAGADGVGVYHVIVKLEVNVLASGANDLISVWVNPDDFDDETATAPTDAFNSYTMVTNSDLQQLTLAGINYTRPVSVDEPRLGTTWASVIPEPASAALLLAGAGVMLGRRRPRRR